MQFDYDSPVIRFLNKAADLLVLNLLFLICCVPIVTIGASITAMYAVNLRSVRYGDGYVFQNFTKAFMENFKQATAAWLIMLTGWVLIYIDVQFWSAAEAGMLSKAMIAVSYAIAAGLFALQTWLFPVIAKMRDKLKVQFANAAKMAVGYFIPYTLVCLLIQGVVYYMAYVNVAMLVVLFVVGFAAVSYICSFFLYKVFSTLIEEESLGVDDLLYKDDRTEE